MAAFLNLQSFVDAVKPSICTSRFVFGCELNGSARSYTFKVSEEDDSDHFLALNMVCLSEAAKDECNIVEVVGRDYQNKEIVVPVANLKLSCQPWLCLDNFEFQPPVTFRLRSGSGPVHLAGQHQIFHRKDLSEDDEEEDEEEDFSEADESLEGEEELPPIKPAKKQQKS
ncbi:nucleoplasmin-3 [Varanus komodoensis]|uniref:Nucleoplasmin-3 n=1 Tax=Varanus komodoensis TaxID=61221 RepID=A0A8D2LF56_VARKO|nr:nucleoplasmin-3 [Varanus komodoensis]